MRPTLWKHKLPIVIPSYFTSGSIPGVEGRINGQCVNIVLDTGCGAMLISKSCVENCGLRVFKQNKRNVPSLVGPSGEILKQYGEVICVLRLAKFKVKLRLQVVENLSADILLGTPFFKKYNAIIDFLSEKVSLTIGKDNDLTRMELPMVENVPKNLIAAEAVIIPPFGEKLITVRKFEMKRNNTVMIKSVGDQSKGFVGCPNAIANSNQISR
ncbi:hypothetical protein B4U79_17052, partial [Dinothrombium tinctorium]